MMSRRLKVLISAYACEPGKGSEPEVGWQWAGQMARFHDVTVLTRANNRTAIEQALAGLPATQPRPKFIYHDLSPGLLKLKRLTRGVKWYYLRWQQSAQAVVARLQQQESFDLLHHVTIAGYRFPTAIWGHGVASIWGPVGGIESIPFSLLPWGQPLALGHELLRVLNNWRQTGSLGKLNERARASTTLLSSTPEMVRIFNRLGCDSKLMPTIGLQTNAGPYTPRTLSHGPLRCLFVGNIITLKGIDLALDALQASNTNATFTLVGSGDYLAAAQRQAARLGLEKRVCFRGRLPRNEVLQLYRDFDVYLLPSLHDTGSFALIEAMLHELPGICLDCGGPAVALTDACGVKVPLASRPQVIAGLAAALQQYDQNRELLLTHGRAARALIQRNYDWDQKGAAMNKVYLETVARWNQSSAQR